MKPLAQLYVQQFKTTLAMMFQYRASLVIWTIGQVLEPLVYLIVWSVVANSSGGSIGDYTTADFAAYFIVLMLVNQVTYTWIMYEFEHRVREGILSVALLKPVHPIHSDIADNISSKIITLPIMIAIAIIFTFAFHASVSGNEEVECDISDSILQKGFVEVCHPPAFSFHHRFLEFPNCVF